MSFSLANLLIHEEAVPLRARAALAAASLASPTQRQPLLELAATILHTETGLECRDSRELVGLPDGLCI
jgi:hypothetical protein